MSRAYRQGVARREQLASRLGWLLPPLGLQHAMHEVAGTGVTAQVAYQGRIRAYHAELRRFYYPYLFGRNAPSLGKTLRGREFGSGGSPKAN